MNPQVQPSQWLVSLERQLTVMVALHLWWHCSTCDGTAPLHLWWHCAAPPVVALLHFRALQGARELQRQLNQNSQTDVADAESQVS